MSTIPETEVRPLTPAARARNDQIRGVPVVLAGGHTWTLPYAKTHHFLDEIRDRLFDYSVLANQYFIEDLRGAAGYLLFAAYEVTREEAFTQLLLPQRANNEDDTDSWDYLYDAVVEALIGTKHHQRTYSAWVYTCLKINGIDPATVGPDELPHMLSMLVMMNRAPAQDQWVESAEALSKRSQIMHGLQGR